MTSQENGHSFDKYVEDAAVEDFVLTFKDSEPIRITNLDYVRTERFGYGYRSGDSDLVFAALCGDAYSAVKAKLMEKKAGPKAVGAIVEDILEHFDLYEEHELVGPSGGTVREKSPTKIKSLQNMGYKIKGE